MHLPEVHSREVDLERALITEGLEADIALHALLAGGGAHEGDAEVVAELLLHLLLDAAAAVAGLVVVAGGGLLGLVGGGGAVGGGGVAAVALAGQVECVGAGDDAALALWWVTLSLERNEFRLNRSLFLRFYV